MIIPQQMAFFAVIAITVGGLLWRRGNRVLVKGIRTEATVVSNVHKRDNEGTMMYYPVIEFITVTGKLVTKELSVGTSWERAVDRRLIIVYDPDAPDDLVTAPAFQLEVLPKLFVAVGLGVLIAAILDIVGITSMISE